MMTPLAPAASALATFTEKLQVPLWMSAMFPTGNPLKSDAWQPLAELGDGVGGITTPPAAVSPAVTSPLPDQGKARKSAWGPWT
jgi:hypothetical protein